MQVGVTFPRSEIGADPIAIRDYAQAAEDLGYEHLLAYDHVLGADPTNREGWRGYTHETMFHEPLTLFATWPPSRSVSSLSVVSLSCPSGRARFSPNKRLKPTSLAVDGCASG